MKGLRNYLVESASLYDCCGPYEQPYNFIEYETGDKTFGELVAGDIVYVYSYEYQNLIEVTADGPVQNKKGNYVIKTQPYKLKPNSKYEKKKTVLIVGPAYSSMGSNFGEEYKSYDPNKVESSSLCVAWSGGYVFGTNKETVRKYAKTSIGNSIKKIQTNIEKLQQEIEEFNKKLEAI